MHSSIDYDFTKLNSVTVVLGAIESWQIITKSVLHAYVIYAAHDVIMEYGCENFVSEN